MLTAPQRKCLAAIEDLTAERGGMSPTIEQIKSRIGSRSKGHVDQFLKILEERKFIRRAKHRRQGIEVIRPTHVKAFRFDDETKTLVPFDPG